jgi:hypothetical protein
VERFECSVVPSARSFATLRMTISQTVSYRRQDQQRPPICRNQLNSCKIKLSQKEFEAS